VIQAGVKHGCATAIPSSVTLTATASTTLGDVAPLLHAVEQGGGPGLARAICTRGYRGSWPRRAGRRCSHSWRGRLTGTALHRSHVGLCGPGKRGGAVRASPASRTASRRDALCWPSRRRLRTVELPRAMRPSLNPHSQHDGFRAWPTPSTCCSRSWWPPWGGRPISGVRSADPTEGLLPDHRRPAAAGDRGAGTARRLRVEYSWLWIASSLTIVLLILRCRPADLADRPGGRRATALHAVLSLHPLPGAAQLNYSVRLTTLTRQVKELAQEIALLRWSSSRGGRR